MGLVETVDGLQPRGKAFDAEAPRRNYAGGATTGSTHRLAHRIEQLESEIIHRELLLEGLIHRTKNTLQLAVAILGERADSTGDPRIRRIVRGVQKQILILCRAHDRFYRPIYTAGRSLSLRIAGICSSIRDSFGLQGGLAVTSDQGTTVRVWFALSRSRTHLGSRKPSAKRVKNSP